MTEVQLTPEDMKQVMDHGLEIEKLSENMAFFEKGRIFADIDKPCSVGDGIVKLDVTAAENCVKRFETSVSKRGINQFVPASGAASRMFKCLLKVSSSQKIIDRKEITRLAEQKGGEYKEVGVFLENLSSFAFFSGVCRKMRESGLDPEVGFSRGDYTDFVSFLLEEKGLGYNGYPKGLIPFHLYPGGPRTPFEEHLVEASHYATDKDAACSLHFTVPLPYQQKFICFFNRIRESFEKQCNTIFKTSFSAQSPLTDTLAVDMENRPFRDRSGRLVFRPGGHGSLLENLERLEGDIIFIKNIDNVATQRFTALRVFWKKVLAGYLMEIEEKIFGYIHQLCTQPADDGTMDRALDGAGRTLCLDIPWDIYQVSADAKREFLIRLLNRPIRVCGMVERNGAPGGGPFWVRRKDGTRSIQIVETAQIDLSLQNQREQLERITHFNPVDIVASVRDRHFQPFKLSDFVDHDAAFITEKSMDGRDMRVLEWPGLWNGSMACWNTFFVEVPTETFSPVKTVNDLLMDAHSYHPAWLEFPRYGLRAPSPVETDRIPEPDLSDYSVREWAATLNRFIPKGKFCEQF